MCDEYIPEEPDDDRDEIEHHAVMELYAEVEYERRIFDSYPHDQRWRRAISSLALYSRVGRGWTGAYERGFATAGRRALP